MKLKKVVYLSKEKFEKLINGELEGKTYNPDEEQYLIPDGEVVVETSGTMQTSTLPSRTVPLLTKAQVEEIYTTIDNGGYVIVKDNYGKYVVTEVDNTNDEVRFTYFGVHLGYYIDGNNVIAEEISSEKLYLQYITVNTYGNEINIRVLTPKSTPLEIDDFSSLESLCKNVRKIYLDDDPMLSESYLNQANFIDGMISFNGFTIYTFSDIQVRDIVGV